MTRAEAIKEFGSVTELAKALGITPQAISQWPEKLSQAKIDRVELARLRKVGLVPRYSNK